MAPQNQFKLCSMIILVVILLLNTIDAGRSLGDIQSKDQNQIFSSKNNGRQLKSTGTIDRRVKANSRSDKQQNIIAQDDMHIKNLQNRNGQFEYNMNSQQGVATTNNNNVKYVTKTQQKRQDPQAKTGTQKDKQGKLNRIVSLGLVAIKISQGEEPGSRIEQKLNEMSIVQQAKTVTQILANLNKSSKAKILENLTNVTQEDIEFIKYMLNAKQKMSDSQIQGQKFMQEQTIQQLEEREQKQQQFQMKKQQEQAEKKEKKQKQEQAQKQKQEALRQEQEKVDTNKKLRNKAAKLNAQEENQDLSVMKWYNITNKDNGQTLAQTLANDTIRISELKKQQKNNETNSDKEIVDFLNLKNDTNDKFLKAQQDHLSKKINESQLLNITESRMNLSETVVDEEQDANHKEDVKKWIDTDFNQNVMNRTNNGGTEDANVTLFKAFDKSKSGYKNVYVGKDRDVGGQFNTSELQFNQQKYKTQQKIIQSIVQISIIIVLVALLGFLIQRNIQTQKDKNQGKLHRKGNSSKSFFDFDSQGSPVQTANARYNMKYNLSDQSLHKVASKDF